VNGGIRAYREFVARPRLALRVREKQGARAAALEGLQAPSESARAGRDPHQASAIHTQPEVARLDLDVLVVASTRSTLLSPRDDGVGGL